WALFGHDRVRGVRGTIPAGATPGCAGTCRRPDSPSRACAGDPRLRASRVPILTKGFDEMKRTFVAAAVLAALLPVVASAQAPAKAKDAPAKAATPAGAPAREARYDART